MEKKEFDGRLHVMKTMNYPSGSIEQKGCESGLERTNNAKSADELKRAKDKADQDLVAYESALSGERLYRQVGCDSQEVADINNDHGRHLIDGASAARRIMNHEHLTGEAAKDMRQKELSQQKLDEEDMQDATLIAKVKVAKSNANVETVDPAEARRRLTTEYQTRVLERVARLEALLITTRQSKKRRMQRWITWTLQERRPQLLSNRLWQMRQIRQSKSSMFISQRTSKSTVSTLRVRQRSGPWRRSRRL